MDKKIALVTGAGSGVGRACSIALAKQGFFIVLVGRRKAALKQTLAALQDGHGISMTADVSDPAAVNDLFERVETKFARLDLLFNNAGTGAPPLPLEDLTSEQWQRVVGTNLNGTFYCSQQAFRLMKQQQPQGGRIINNGSISAQSPRPNSAPYTATKHAISGLTKSLSLDGRAYNIACGQIDIGNALTEMTARMSQGVPQADGSLVIEPTMDVEDIAAAVAFMAQLPLASNVQHMTVMATKMPLIGRG
jgi:NAD(P)-dependent dehydrogenase (short-subunit alcohol dehydrogenase family)